MCRSDLYVGGVADDEEPLAVEGRKPGDCGIGLGVEASRKLAVDARSRGDGETCRDLDLSRSLNLLFRNNASNCVVRPLAHSSLL